MIGRARAALGAAGRRRLALRVGIPAALVAAAVLAALLVAGRSSDAAATSGDGAAAGAATVERRDIAERESLGGTLGYADPRPVVNQLSGTITWVAPEGAVRRPGQVLYRVDESPVILLDGAVPAYRDLGERDEGADVRQLQRNLVALEYDPEGAIEVDGSYGWATAAAVRRWQEDRGLEQTGRVERGRAVFLPGARRMGPAAAVGTAARPGGQVVPTTSVARSVTLELDARRQHIVAVGDAERVELPDGTTVSARVAEIGTVAAAGADGASPTVTVTLSLAESAVGAAPDGAPVTVSIVTERRRDVLAVPIAALLALAGGGFGLERIDAGGGTTIVSAEIGLAADGYVEVSGPGVTEGMRVAVPE